MSNEVAYDRLHPSLRYVVATNLGWRELRPVQRDAIGPILDGATTVVVAPTAGGKTEAAVLPLFSRMLDQRWLPTSVLYLAPLRALLNDLGERVGGLAGHLGLETAVWHGDIGQRERRRIAAAPPDLLLTTPESLEVLLSFAKDDRRALLATVRAVVVDEAHAFYGVDRGTHLLALIERLAAWASHDIQRIALSATIGNPEDLLTWLGGTSARPKALVRVAPSAERVEAFEVRYKQGTGVVAEIERFKNEKVIAFARTRSDVEELAHALTEAGVDAWAHHSALSRENREDAEQSFREGRHGVLVATSTLELGIDIGDLDRVVQVDAPTTVASLLQRLGRTGRRGGAARMSFIPTNPEQFILVAALLLLHREGWVEPLTPPWRPYPILAQQALAHVLQTGGIAPDLLVERLTGNAAFATIEQDEVEALLSHLVTTDILALIDGVLSFGHNGERQFEYRGFMELASVFSTSESVIVRHGSHDVGTLDEWFIDDMMGRDRSSFLLNGRAWNVVRWPEADAVLEVAPGSMAQAPLFLGGGLVLSYEVMQAVRRVLRDDDALAQITQSGTIVSDGSAAMLSALQRDAAAQRLELTSSPIVHTDGLWQWFTYGGLRANRLISDAVLAPLGIICTATNASIRIRASTLDFTRLTDAVREFADESALSAAMPTLVARRASRVKFGDLLPQAQLRAFVGEQLYDAAGSARLLRLGVRLSTDD